MPRWTLADLAARGYRVPLATDTPEGTLLAQVRQLATRSGFLCYHTHDSRRSEGGFPDLVLCNGTDLLLMELKTNTGKPTREQQQWLSLLAHTGKVEAGIWRPRDWSAIQERLTHKEPRR